MTFYINAFQEKAGISVVRLLHVLLVLFSLWGTQLLFPINILGRTIHLYYVEIFLLCILMLVSILTIKRKKGIVIKKTEGLILGAFIVWFFILTVYRYVFFGNITGGFIVFRVLVFPILLVWMLRQMNAYKSDVLFGILLFTTSMNAYQVYSVFIVGSFRTVLALKNINIYLCFMLAMIPVLFMMVKQIRYTSPIISVIVKSIISFNVLTILVFSFFSGSRLSVVVLPSVFFVSFFVTYGINKSSLIKLGIVIVSFVLVVTTILRYNVFDSRYNVARTWFEVLNSVGIHFSLGDIQDKNESETENSSWQDEEKIDNNVDENDILIDNNFDEFTQSVVDNNVTDSNNMRYKLWKQSIKHIKESPLWGRTSIDIEVEMNFAGYDTPVKIIQSPHNFILEGWLALGLPGLLLYGFILFTTTISILRKKIKASIKVNVILVLFVIFGFSFFQPLVTCYFAISLLLWLVLYLFKENELVSVKSC